VGIGTARILDSQSRSSGREGRCAPPIAGGRVSDWQPA
jgi:hypothetical protein